jgi:hypothetical protein
VWWLLPAIGAVGGALTNLNKPNQMFKNALLGAGLGFGASAIPGASEGAAKFLGIGQQAANPEWYSRFSLRSPEMDKFVNTSPEDMMRDMSFKGAKNTWASLQNPMLGMGIFQRRY